MTMCSCPLNSCATGSLNVLPTFVNVRYTDKKTKKEDCELVNEKFSVYNSNIKCVFQVEENDIQILKDVMNLSEVEKYKILNQERGTCLMYAGRNHLLVKVIASEYEHSFISTDRKDL